MPSLRLVAINVMVITLDKHGTTVRVNKTILARRSASGEKISKFEAKVRTQVKKKVRNDPR